MRLTDREEQVIDAVALGLSDREIGLRLGVSPYTVSSHVRRILVKLGAVNRTDAAVRWARAGSPAPVARARDTA